MGEEILQTHFLYQVTGFHLAVGEKHDAHQQRQQEDMHHIKHPGPAQDAHAGDQKAVAAGDLAVGQYRGVAGEKDKDLRRVAETEIAHGEAGERVLRHVIPENEDQRQPAEKVDAMIASVGYHGKTLGRMLKGAVVAVRNCTRTAAACRLARMGANCKTGVLLNVTVLCWSLPTSVYRGADDIESEFHAAGALGKLALPIIGERTLFILPVNRCHPPHAFFYTRW